MFHGRAHKWPTFLPCSNEYFLKRGVYNFVDNSFVRGGVGAQAGEGAII
jgi:hypothetical protein